MTQGDIDGGFSSAALSSPAYEFVRVLATLRAK